jgi:hypothetical protein
MNPNNNINTIFFPDGRPVPEVLIEKELIELLRLDENGPKDPALTIHYYRDKGLLRGIRIGKRIRYTKQEVIRFLEKQTDWTNRKQTA